MQKAVTALIDLEVVDLASEVAKDHELYGVLEPTADVAAGSKGVGMLVEVAAGLAVVTNREIHGVQRWPAQADLPLAQDVAVDSQRLE